MQYLIALDPKLNLSVTEFVTAWNHSEHAANGKATVDEVPPGSFMSPEMAVALVAVAATIPATVITNLVTEILKKKFIDSDKPKITITTVNTPDGRPVLIIKQGDQE